MVQLKTTTGPMGRPCPPPYRNLCDSKGLSQYSVEIEIIRKSLSSRPVIYHDSTLGAKTWFGWTFPSQAYDGKNANHGNHDSPYSHASYHSIQRVLLSLKAEREGLTAATIYFPVYGDSISSRTWLM